MRFVLFLLLVATSTTTAQVSFAPATVYPVSRGALAAGDVTGDGAVEIIGASGSSPVMLPNQGQGTFGLPQAFTAGTGTPASGVVRDLDGDGDVDIVSANNNPGQLAIVRNTGNGSLVPWQVIPVTQNVGPVIAGDVNGDGRIDLVHAQSSVVQIYLNMPNGTFIAGPAIPASFPEGIVLADLDMDGDLDLCVSRPTGNPQVQVYQNLGGGLLLLATTTPLPPQTLPNGPRGLAAADIDADGDLDLLGTQSNTSGSVLVWRNLGNWTFQAFTSIPVAPSLRPIVAADFDGDGRADVAAGATDEDRVYVLRGLAGGNFAPPVPFNTGDLWDMIVADVDGDGDPDIVVGNQQISVLRNLRPTPPVGPFPGTGEDFFLLTGINASPNSGPGLTIKSAHAQDQLSIRLQSVAGTFVGAPIALGIQLFVTGSAVPGTPAIPNLHLSFPGAAFLVGDPSALFPVVLPGSGFLYPVLVPPGLAGQSVILQGAAFSPAALNGYFALSDAHEIRFVP